MPIYEYYCPDNHTIYQFFAKTLAQGKTVPKCPDNPKFRLKKVLSKFAISKGGASDDAPPAAPAADDPQERRIDAAMNQLEPEFARMDENDPKAMAQLMRKVAAATGEKMTGQFEEVVRKLEEGADPDSLEDQLPPEETAEDSGDPMGGGMGLDPGMPPMKGPKDPKEPRHRFRARNTVPRRDPKLYDFE